jgi:outer membrane protein TolC
MARYCRSARPRAALRREVGKGHIKPRVTSVMEDLLRSALSVASLGPLLVLATLGALSGPLRAQPPSTAPPAVKRWTFDASEDGRPRRLGPAPLATTVQAAQDVPDRLPPPNEVGGPPAASGPGPLPSWWDERVHEALWPDAIALPVSLESLLAATLTHSQYVQVIKDIPLIRETAIAEARANFDWVSFLESRWNDVSEPVGNLLTTGRQLTGSPVTIQQDRYRDQHLTARGGLRRRSALGGRLEIAQEVGRQRTNSDFFVPERQGTSRIAVTFTQPLLRGAGGCYNRSLIVLAELDAATGADELSRELQNRLVQVATAYWQLYLNRGRLLQKRRLLMEAEQVLGELENRSELDVLRSQVVRARAAVESRSAEIARAETEVRNTESLLRSLVNDPSLGSSQHHELIPQDTPMVVPRALDRVEAVETALRNRPEVSQSVKQIRAASVRLRMSKNELLPALNVILDTYVSGLRDNYDIGAAWLDQYRLGEPTYSAALEYELPLGNRVAKSRYQRRQLELRQLEADLKVTMENLRQEVEVAVAEVLTTYQEMAANHRAMEAAAVNVDYVHDRWQLLPGSDRSASFLLDDLLSAQERLSATEYAFLQAQVAYNVAQMLYVQALGTLLQSERISIERFRQCHLPNLQLQMEADPPRSGGGDDAAGPVTRATPDKKETANYP